MDFARYKEDLLGSRPAGAPENLVVLERVTSTNLLARAVVADYDRECQALPTALLVAYEQTAGKGRLGRSWSSPPGLGVYASRTLSVARPEVLQTLPLLVGVGLARALDAYLPTPSRRKWPNDLLVAGKKIGGVLIESLVRPGDCAMVVVGFGVNLGHTAADLPQDRAATSIRLEGGEGGPEVPLPRLTWDLVLGVENELHHLGDAAYAVAAYRERTVHRPGDLLTCQVGEERVSGRFVGFDPEGRLLLSDGSHEIRLSAGEIIEG